MARTVDTSSTLEQWRQNYNTLATEVGDPASLRTGETDSIVNAINYIQDQYFFFQDFDYDGSDGASTRTVFSGADNSGNTLQYMSSKVLVYKNGLLLRSGTDYIAVDGTSITLTSSAGASDVIRISSYTGSYTATPAGQESLFKWQISGGNIWNSNYGNTAGIVFNANADNAGEIVTTPTVDDSIQFEGAVYHNYPVTVGVDDTGHDVKFFGATSGSYMLWDESTDDLILGGASQLGIGTTAPTKLLHIRKSGDDSIMRLESQSVASWDFSIRNTSTLTGVGSGALELLPQDGNSYFAIGQAGTTTVLLHVKNTGIYVVPGLEATPAYSFTTDTNTGMYLATTDTLTFATGGTERVRIDASGVVTANAGIVVDTITIDAGQIDQSSGDLTLDVAGDIILDVDGDNIWFDAAGTRFLSISNVSSDVYIGSEVSDKDIIFRGNDGGSTITALTLDMSSAGAATFNSDIKLPDSARVTFGAGDDLQIYHDGSDSVIADLGSGDLKIKGSNDLVLTTHDDENYIACVQNGAVSLYYDNAVKLATVTGGINITGDTDTDTLTVSGNGTVGGTLGVTGVATFTAVPVLPANTIDSDHYVDGSIDTAHIGDLQVTGSKIANATIDGTQIATNSITATEINVSGNGTSGYALVSDGDGSFSYAAFSGSNTTYTTSWVDDSANAILRLTPSAGGDDDLTIVAGSGITLTPSGDNLTIAAAGGTASLVTVADESSDTTCFPLFVTAATGDLGPKSGSNLAFNSSTGALTATSFVGVLTGSTITASGTLAVTGETTLSTHLNMGDSDIIKLGADADLTIYHDGSDSYITDVGTGILFIRGSSSIRLQAASGESCIDANENAAVNLYYDNGLKLATRSIGIMITGDTDTDTLTVSGNGTVGGTLGVTGVATFTAVPVLPDNTIGTAHIADNSVNLYKMAGLARGKIIYGNSSGDPTALTVGSSGQVLKSDGTDISWGTDTGLTTEEVQDIAGAMFSSNTETGITATYQDGDGTIDLVVGSATGVTVTDSTANTNFPVIFHDESNALLDDTGALRYNPSTGTLLVPNLTVAGTTTQVDTVTMEAANAIIFEGATADNYETTLTVVDPTAGRTQYLINATGYIPVLAAATTSSITSTPAELNLLDGSVANTVVNSKGVIYGSSGELAGTLSTAAQTNITSLGTLTALTVDDIAINSDGITLNGGTGDTATLTAGSNGDLTITTVDAAGANANYSVVADGTISLTSTGQISLISGAAISIEPAAGSVISLDGTISIDAGVVAGATSITSTAFVGGTISAVAGSNDPAIELTGGTASQSYGKIHMTGAGTAVDIIRINNDGGATLIGTDRNTGGGLAANTLGYSSVFGSIGATAAHIITNNTTKMTVLSDGKVGIGDTSPSYTLDVAGTLRVTGVATFDAVPVFPANTVDEANLEVSNSPTNGYVLTAQSGNTGGLTWASSTGAVSAIANFANNRVITASSSTALNGEANLEFDGTSLYNSGGKFGLDANDFLEWSNDAYFDVDVAGATRMRVESDGDLHVTGDVIAFTTTSISDIALKENINPITNALDKVLQLGGYSFDWKDKKRGSSTGLIAQEVEKVLPELVKDPKGLTNSKTLNYNGIIGLLVESIKELKNEIESMKNSKT